ncbi:MAG: hypothetical protein D6B28_06070 [Gammaproteobacteria bacterium]|nr:MAG: hypothetical protein D6B28_06070 [Gammaproteobacteria bacterium]
MKLNSLTFLCFSLSIAGAVSAKAEETIVLATQNWPPYQIDTGSGLSGIAAEKVSCALEKMGKPFEFKVYPWRRAQKEVKSGYADAFFSASPNKERSEYATISDKVADQKWNWYLLKENLLNPEKPQFKTLAKTTALLGSNTQTWLQSNGYKIGATSVDLKEVFQFLDNKKIDVVLSTDKAAESAIMAKGGKLSDYNIYTLKSNILGVYWSKEFLKKNHLFLQKFNSALGKCN